MDSGALMAGVGVLGPGLELPALTIHTPGLETSAPDANTAGASVLMDDTCDISQAKTSSIKKHGPNGLSTSTTGLEILGSKLSGLEISETKVPGLEIRGSHVGCSSSPCRCRRAARWDGGAMVGSCGTVRLRKLTLPHGSYVWCGDTLVALGDEVYVSFHFSLPAC